MDSNDPFVCKRCHGVASYFGKQERETIYRCRSCGGENRITYKPIGQQQPQTPPKEEQQAQLGGTREPIPR
jgi:hypothetical protein